MESTSIDIECQDENKETRQLLHEEWINIIARLWIAAGQTLDPERLTIYGDALADIPLGLLERAINRLIRERVFSNVPQPGAVWDALKKELGNPIDVYSAIKCWIESYPIGWKVVNGEWMPL